MKQVYINYQGVPANYTHEYNIVQENESTCLFRSTDSDWSKDAKGGMALHVFDSGNNIEIEFQDRDKITLDYYQVQELFILLLNMQDVGIEFRESKTTMKWPSSQ